MKDLNKIVTSELVIRTNNITFAQEYGEVGVDNNITEVGNNTIFTTKWNIIKIIYITVNGINLIEGRHYEIIDKKTISISKDGDVAIKKLPGLTTTILVGYNYSNRVAAEDIVSNVPPSINAFYLNREQGAAGELIFNFNIVENDAKNIFWSILKDGNEIPLYSGNALFTSNGSVPDGTGGTIYLNHYITQSEYMDRQGEDIPFTLVVIYDLSDDGSRLNEKLLSSTNYLLVVAEGLTGSLVSSPELITTEGLRTIDVNYSIDIAGVTLPYEWVVTEVEDGGAITTIASGNQTNSPSGMVQVSHTFAPGDNKSYRYSLNTKLLGATEYTVTATDITNVAIPGIAEIGKAGYLDTAVFNYEVSAGVWETIGGTGTSQDLIEYNNRIPPDIFTKTVDISYLTSNDFIAAPVQTYGGLVTQVHFVIEVPESWGPFTFNQALGEIPIIDFNVIDLGNGTKAYLYRIGPSSASNPSDYYLNQ